MRSVATIIADIRRAERAEAKAEGARNVATARIAAGYAELYEEHGDYTAVARLAAEHDLKYRRKGNVRELVRWHQLIRKTEGYNILYPPFSMVSVRSILAERYDPALLADLWDSGFAARGDERGVIAEYVRTAKATWGRPPPKPKPADQPASRRRDHLRAVPDVPWTTDTVVETFRSLRGIPGLPSETVEHLIMMMSEIVGYFAEQDKTNTTKKTKKQPSEAANS